MAYIHGEFKNLNNITYSVSIVSNNDTSEEIVIGENGLYFADDPVEIEMDNEDTFQHIIMQSATINLVTDNYIGDKLFANNARDVKVTIMNEDTNEYVFSGYVEPNTFSQPYNLDYDSFTINCTDALATLQYYNYGNINYNNYDTKRIDAANVSFLTILQDMFAEILENTDDIYYDCSKGVSSSRLQTVFSDLGISELNMIGETVDDLWIAQDTLEEILKYLNLHIVQIGRDFYIFDWNTIKTSGTKSFIGLINGGTKTISSSFATIMGDMHTSGQTNITVTDVYSQIQITCELEELEDIIESPLESDYLTSVYSNRQKYMTEYISEGSGQSAIDAFNAILHTGETTDYDGFITYEWFMQVMENKNWKLYIDNGQTELSSLYETNSDGVYINQDKIPRYLKQHALTPAIFTFGSVKKKSDTQDNSVINKIDSNDYLYISVNGNEVDTENSQSPTDTDIYNHYGMIEYKSNTGGVVLSPNDSETTNYLVFSGKIVLQPIVYESSSTYTKRTNNYVDIVTNGAADSQGEEARVPIYDGQDSNQNNLVSSDNNTEGRYYTRKFYTIQNPKTKIDEDTDYYTDTVGSLQPWTEDKSAHGYNYSYSAIGDGTDTYSKLPILECELIIGNKRLVETNIDEAGNSTFAWYTIGNEPYIDGVQKTTFSLGVNPKIGDNIIGDEFDIQNTIDYTMGIDADGTAIPITIDDSLSGEITFRILGPINLLWNNITRRHPSFWRHTSWSEDSRFILSHTENIIIKDFECKIYTDSGLNNITEDNDLIYISAENINYVNKKDDIEFKFVTQLTSAERLQKGIETGIIMNGVINNVSGLPLTSIYNNAANTTDINNTAKPEEHYIAQYYRAYTEPKILLDMDLDSRDISFFSLFASTPLLRNFFVQSIGNNLMYDSAHVTLKQI